ncbi:MAG TPA: condensation domain-containing protein, partial [Longimicrobium sp.]
APSAAELRAHLAARVPEYMVPSAFVAMDALPLTRNGKVDRRARPEPDAVASAEYVAPRTPTEEALAGIWAPLLGAARVSAEDGFFALGGHSLLATRVVTRVRDAFGVDLPLRAIFESPTLSALAAEIDRLAGTGAGVGTPSIVPVERTNDLPLSFAQEHMWRMARAQPDSTAFTIGTVFRFSGELDADALERALAELVRRHEALRTVFPAVDGQPVQRILSPGFHLPRHDLAALPDDARAFEAERILREPFATPFDLARGPLFRAVLVRLGDDEHRFALSMHHLVSDGWSLGVLLGELSALYTAFSRGEPSPLPETAIQYADYATWQRGRVRGQVLDAHVAYWRAMLEGAPPLLRLPTDRPRPAVPSLRGAEEHLLLPSDEHAAVRALARAEGATLYMTLLAALATVLSRLSGQREVVVGTPIATRPPGTEPLVGLFVTGVALRVAVDEEESFRALLRRVRQTTLEAYAHQDVPFARVVDAMQTERIPGAAPVFQAVLNVLSYEEGSFALPGVEVEAYGHAGDQTSKFDLTLYAQETPAGLHLRLVY